jgi:hypothetical protein
MKLRRSVPIRSDIVRPCMTPVSLSVCPALTEIHLFSKIKRTPPPSSSYTILCWTLHQSNPSWTRTRPPSPREYLRRILKANNQALCVQGDVQALLELGKSPHINPLPERHRCVPANSCRRASVPGASSGSTLLSPSRYVYDFRAGADA